MFKESISSSSIVKVATQVYVANGKYLVRGNKKVTSVSSVAWSTSATDIGKDEYLKRYGSVILGLNNYILNDDTIDGIELTKESDKYIFVINANVEKATKNIVKEMKTNANSKSEPVFSVAKLTITTDSSLNVISVKYECVYKVEVAVLGKVECTENMTEYYYGFNQTTTFPEEGFFNQFL